MNFQPFSLALFLTAAAVGCASSNQHGQDTNKAAAATDGNSDDSSPDPHAAPPPGRDTERAKERDEEMEYEPDATHAKTPR